MASRSSLVGLVLLGLAAAAPLGAQQITCDELLKRAGPRHVARKVWESEPGIRDVALAGRAEVPRKEARAWLRRWGSAASGEAESDCKLYPSEEWTGSDDAKRQEKFEKSIRGFSTEKESCGSNLEACRFRIVDCRLPPALRRLGRRLPSISPQRWVRTTAGECKDKKGRFYSLGSEVTIRVEDAETAAPAFRLLLRRSDGTLRELGHTGQGNREESELAGESLPAPTPEIGSGKRQATTAWERDADLGVACAQNYLGEIHRRNGRYESARERFEEAAMQGYERALINLGDLYEHGRGVAKDPVAALACYEAATGEEMALDGSSVTAAMRSGAGPKIRLKKPVIVLANPRLQGRRQVSTELSADGLQLAGTVYRHADLERFEVNGFDWLGKLDGDSRFDATLLLEEDGGVDVRVVDVQGSDDSVGFAVQDGTARAGSSDGSRARSSVGSGGGYYALLIGNQVYDAHPRLENLSRPHSDTRALAEVLKNRWGFQTELLLDEDLDGILSAFDRLRRRLGPEDHLLIYYAGHGEFLSHGLGKEGFWLPRDALPRPRRQDAEAVRESVETWLSSWEIARQVEFIRARNILVVADSCYSGTWSRSALPDGSNDSRSVTVLTSGDEREVLDGVPGRKHSLFAQVLLSTLETWEDPLAEDELWFEVRDRFARELEKTRELLNNPDYEQVPTYSPELTAGHKGGKFVLIPTAPSGSD